MSSALVVEPPRSRARTGNGPVPHTLEAVGSEQLGVGREEQLGVGREEQLGLLFISRADVCFLSPQPYARATVPGCFSSDGKAQTFQHPVRLFWPKSKSFDFLYSDGEALLRNFPVQATISFYDDSDSDEDDEESEEDEEDECVKPSSRFTALN
ncbi:protein ripply1 [Eucyclogobius newberryi]|uniref:protein ripply1 n=1 Tax=Eucyclogobius newberryi TaxID=166745 RepID=UPI003B5B01FC